MSEKFSEHGTPQWFSPEHAGEKFKEICMGLTIMLKSIDKSKQRALARDIGEIRDTAEKYAKYYYSECPIRSVRIMHPSGAIFVTLNDGQEVLVPQP